MDIAAAPTMTVSIRNVKRFLLLKNAIAAKNDAQRNNLQGETTLCAKAPSHRAPPNARAL
jgi:glutaredoxin-related protein